MPSASKLLVLACCTALAAGGRAPGETQQLWEEFKAAQGRQYGTAAEEQRRLACFEQNLAEIDRRNAQAAGRARFAVNGFADVCPEEFRRQRLSAAAFRAKRTGYAGPALFSGAEVAAAQQEAFDWRAKGAVTPVGDEGQCGSTWAWAAVDTMEAQWFLAGHKLVALSVQQVNSCDPQSEGCNGGLMDYAYQWVLKNKGIDSAADYPYTSGTGNSGTCNAAKLPKRVAHFSNYTDLPSDEGQLLAWVAKNGPIAVAVNAESWQSYNGGVLTTCDPTNVDHAVSLVGYTPQAGTTPAYWVVKNMWGTKWGEHGYIRLAYGNNTCGLTAYPGTILA